MNWSLKARRQSAKGSQKLMSSTRSSSPISQVRPMNGLLIVGARTIRRSTYGTSITALHDKLLAALSAIVVAQRRSLAQHRGDLAMFAAILRASSLLSSWPPSAALVACSRELALLGAFLIKL